MKKRSRKIIKLVSSKNTGHFYTTTKKKSGLNKKITLKKFDPKYKKHVLYKEEKI